ncbi:FHA domain-containing protein [Candidatus Woesearchaeota archaeon]|nr:FHA domain-containing protein [Candidatus Woesearchaeota archaeon]
MVRRETGENPTDLRTLKEYRKIYFGKQDRFFRTYEGVPFFIEIINPNNPHKDITPEFATPTDLITKKSNAGNIYLESDVHPIRNRIFRSYPLHGKLVEIPANCDPNIIIGRGDICDIVVKDRLVSGLHAKIEAKKLNNDKVIYLLSDCDSKNGTFVVRPEINDKDVKVHKRRLLPDEPHQLVQQDRVRFGDRFFLYVQDPKTMYYFMAAKG